MRPVLRFRYTPTSAQLTASFRYWIDYIVPGTGKAKREPVAGADDPKAYWIEEARAAEGKRKAQKVEAPRVLQRAPEEKMTFKGLAKWYLGQEKVKALRYFPTLTINLTSFNQELGDIIVGQIKSVDLENYQAKRKREGTRTLMWIGRVRPHAP